MAFAFRRDGKNYLSTLSMGNALAPHLELLNAAEVYMDIKQNGQTAVDDYLGRTLLIEGRILTMLPSGNNLVLGLDTPYNAAALDEATKKFSPVTVSVPKQVCAKLKEGE